MILQYLHPEPESFIQCWNKSFHLELYNNNFNFSVNPLFQNELSLNWPTSWAKSTPRSLIGTIWKDFKFPLKVSDKKTNWVSLHFTFKFVYYWINIKWHIVHCHCFSNKTLKNMCTLWLYFLIAYKVYILTQSKLHIWSICRKKLTFSYQNITTKIKTQLI